MRVHGRGGAGGGTPTGWPVAGYISEAGADANLTATANTLWLAIIPIVNAVIFSKLTLFVGTGDGANNSDFGIYDHTGTLVANIGAQILGAFAIVTAAAVQGSVTIQPGLYGIAFTSAGSTLQIFGHDNMCLYRNASFGVSAGGALPASITFPALSPNDLVPAFALS